jgi:hypothetical protein
MPVNQPTKAADGYGAGNPDDARNELSPVTATGMPRTGPGGRSPGCRPRW